jgi:DNA-directed RNA polymerase specialized sigma24 family protein
VENPAAQPIELKRDWALTAGAFRQLLDWLDEGMDSGGQRYLEVRRRLALYFDRKNCLAPDELADETLNRVARRLEEEGGLSSDTPAHYCYIVARYVFLEWLRRQKHESPLDDALGARAAASTLVQTSASGAQESDERRLACLEGCMQKLEPEHRRLIADYYSGEQRVKIDNRREMAARLGITVNALSIRAFRLRERLESCIRKCAGKDG